MPAPIARPMRSDPRRTERMRNSDIGPSWAASSSPMPNPIPSALTAVSPWRDDTAGRLLRGDAEYGLTACEQRLAHRHRAAVGQRHPLRDAAARGRLDAGAGRGRRRRPLRPQVPRRRPGGARARGRAGRRRARTRARARRAGDRAHRRRARPGDPGAHRLERRAQRGARLPARRAAVRARRRRAAGARARRGDRVVRRAHDERRPHAAQPEPAVVARAAVAHRPRRGAVPAARRRRPAGARAAPVPAHPPARAPPLRRVDRRGGCAARAGDHRRARRGGRRRGPARVAARAGRRRGHRAPRVRRVPAAAPRGAAWLRRGRRCRPRRLTSSRTRCCGSSRASSAASSSTRASCCSAGGAGSSRRESSSTSGAWARWRRASTPRACASTSTRSCGSRPATRPEARCRRSSRPSASAGSWRRRARSSSPRRCTPACATTRRPCSTACSPSWSRRWKRGEVEHYGEDLAYVHDAGHGGFARAAAPDLLRRLRTAGLTGGTVVDLGCGSGIWAAELLAAGYDVMGVDVSADLLAIARGRAPAATLVHASLWQAKLPPCVAVTAIGEVLSYAFDPRDGGDGLVALCARVHDALAPGGLFLFDALGPGVVGPQPRRLWRDADDWVVLSEAVEDAGARRLTRRIVVFRRAGEGWRRSDEVHVQHLHEPEELIAAVRAAGFEAALLPGWGAAALRPGAYAIAARRR